MSKSGLGRRLYDVRRKHRLTQEKMADRLSISRSAYQYYERGERDLTSTVLMKISREFKVAPIWLLAGDDVDKKSFGAKKIIAAYRDVGIAVERRVLEICPNMSSGKKWDAINFLFDEAFDFNPLEPDYQVPPLKKIDAVLKLIT